MTVLLVEDDVGIGRFVSQGFAARGASVRWVRSGREVEGLVAAGGINLVILDLGLPGAAWAEETDQREIVVTASPLGGEGTKAADSNTLATSGAVTVADQLGRTAPGVVPSLFRLVGLSPAALDGFLGLPACTVRAIAPGRKEAASFR